MAFMRSVGVSLFLFVVMALSVLAADPVFTTTPPSSVFTNTTFTYDADATDADNDTITFNLTVSPAGMTIDSSTGVVTYMTGTTSETIPVTITASDGTGGVTLQSFNLVVQTPSMLSITDLDVRVGSNSDSNLQSGDNIKDEAQPGDKLRFDFEISNTFPRSSDIEINDIEIEIIIRDIDDGDDLDEESNEFDVQAGDEEDISIDMTVPLDVEEDTFDVEIRAEGRDDNGGTHSLSFFLTLEVEKESHQIKIERADVSPSLLTCEERAFVDVEIRNIGANDEDDVTLEVTSPSLGLNYRVTEIELDEGSGDETEFEDTVRIEIDDNLGPGNYPILVTTFYDGRESESDQINLVVGECESETDFVPIFLDPVEDVEVVVAPSSPVPPAVDARDDSLFSAIPDFNLGAVIVIILFIGTAIFVVGAAIILLRQ